MYKLGNIRTFETANYKVSVDAVEDCDVDLSWDDDGSVREGPENGSLIAFGVVVKVYHKPTGIELGSDSLWNCIYKSIESFMDHKECGVQNRETLAKDGKWQVYRKNRQYENCLQESDRLHQPGFETRELALYWATRNAHEAYKIFETGRCGSYFTDMVREAIAEARKNKAALVAA